MDIFQILFIVAIILSAAAGAYWFYQNKFTNNESPEDDMEIPDSTRQMPEISKDFEIPEEDQQYLLPITVDILKQLAFCKRMFPTNAMLIEHLAESLSIAAQQFEPSKKGESPEKNNEAWLMVAAFAIRLYDEGTPNNCRQTLDAFVSDGTLAKRRLEKWAERINNEIAQKVKEGVVGKDDVKNMADHINTVGETPYTQDEIDDMMNAADQGQSGKDSAFQQAMRDSKDKGQNND